MNPVDFQVVIIGAGFAGLGMGIQLKEAGYDSFVIFERADELGGTWRDNVYPGCACDVPSLVYSYSFDQNPDWSRLYAPQEEILDYLKRCAERFDVRPHIRFNTEVTGLRFDEEGGLWLVETAAGQQVTARVVTAGLGPLNRPFMPEIPGLETFPGKVFHSSEWDQSFEPAGKRVATLGTGASAIQIVPELAKEAAELYVLQRTPPWILPRLDKPLSPLAKKLFRLVPGAQWLARAYQYWLLEMRVLSFLGNDFMNRLGTKMALEHLESSVSDPVLREVLTPDYQLGCKRVLSSDDYYPAVQQENVNLVTEEVDCIEGDTIVLKGGGRFEVDALIFCTGFVASEIYLNMEITGKEGRRLLSEWAKSGPEAYLGTVVSGYPNLFFLLGPNTGLGHNSVVLMMESQYNYILDYLRLLEIEKLPYLDIRQEAQDEYNAKIQADLEKTVWQSGGCRSWYQTAEGKNTTLWPGSTVGYRLRTRKVDPEVFDWEEHLYPTGE